MKKINGNKIYVLTENLNFFYKLNRDLNKFNIPFKILNISKKIPPPPSIVLTTTEEFKTRAKHLKNGNILTYSRDDPFEYYILKVISAFRIGFKKHYSELIFSIDPGNKSGLVVFLDDYYLISHCCFETQDLINKIRNYISYFQIDNPDPLIITLKFGIGVLKITQDLVQRIYRIFNDKKDIRILLIDEFKSSKIKVYNKNKKNKISKDEASALILALRDGIEVTRSNYSLIFNKIKSKSSKNEDFKKEKLAKFNKNSIISEEIADIAAQVLNGDLSLSQSSQMIKEIKINKNFIFKG